MADDMSDIYSAFGGPSVPPPAVAAQAVDGDGPPLTVTRQPSPTGGAGDDLSDLHAVFAKPAPATLPHASAIDTLKDVGESGSSGLARGIASAPFGPVSLGKMGADAIVSGGDWLVRKALGLGPASDATQAAQAAGMAHRPFGMPSALDVGDAAQQALTPYLHTPQTPEGRYAQSIGEFAPALAANPESLASLGTFGGAATAIGAGVVAPAVVSEAAGNAAQGTPYESYARAAGGILGGVAGGAGAHVAGKVADSPMVAKVPAMFGATGMQQRIAGQNLVKGAQDPAAFVKALDLNQAPAAPGVQGADQTIPGFNPTLYQKTGDQGIGQMERADARANPDATGQSGPAPYLAQKAAQDKAQIAFLNDGRAPADHTAIVSQLQDMRDSIDAAAQSKIDAATANAQAKAADIAPGATPDATGADLRAHPDAANRAAKAQEGELHEAIDPNKTLVTSTTPITDAMQRTYGGLSRAAQSFISPAERTFQDLVSSYKPTESYREIADLGSNLAAAMRTEKATNQGTTPAYRRMTQMMGGVKDALSATVQRQADTEAQAVASGQMAPEQTMEARVDALRTKWNLDFGQQTTDASRSLGGVGASAVGLSGEGPSPNSGAGRTERSAAGGTGQAPGDQGIPQEAPVRPIDTDTADRIKAANAATAARKQTYESGPLKPILAPGARAGEFRYPDSAVPALVLRNGPAGYSAVKAYLKASGNTPEALSSLQGAIAETLRAKIGSDGMLPQQRLDAWKARLQHVLRAVDEVEPGYSSKFDDVPKATQAVTDAILAKKQALKDFQAGTIGKLLGAQGSDEVVAHIRGLLRAPDRIPQIDRLVAAAKGNPNAEAGLRSAVEDAVAKDFTTTRESGDALKPNQFQKALSDKMPALSRVPGVNVDNMRLVAKTMDQQALSIEGSRLKGGSDTTQNTNASASGHVAHGTFLLAAMEGMHMGYEHGGMMGGAMAGAGAAGGYMLKALRSSGIHDVNHLVGEALRNPDVARQLVKRVSPNLYREQRLAGLVHTAILKGGSDDGPDGAPPNTPPPTGPFSRGGAGASAAPLGPGAADTRGRIEPSVEPLPGSRANVVTAAKPSDLNVAAAHVDTAPTPAQAEAGNYRKGHAIVEGLPVSIENPRGSVRSGVGDDGQPWSVKMPADYGYLKGTSGADGEQVDTYIGRRPSDGTAHVVDQVDPKTGAFDEHKVILHGGSPEQAAALYRRGFSDGKGGERLGDITTLPLDDLKQWLAQPQTRPMSEKLRDANAARERVPTEDDAATEKRVDAALALGREFDAAGVRRHDISRDLAASAHDRISKGEVDHGQALEDAALSRLPKDVRDAAFSETAQDGGGPASGEGKAAGNVGGRAASVDRDGAGSRSAREAGEGARNGSNVARLIEQRSATATIRALKRILGGKD